MNPSDAASFESLQAGYGFEEIPLRVGSALAGRPTIRPRLAARLRDSLGARALHLRSGQSEATLVSADLVLTTTRLQHKVAELAGIPAESLLAFATHTHSGLGGYWRGRLVESFLGAYSEEVFLGLARALANAVRKARSDLRAVRVEWTASTLEGTNESRRRPGGAVDRTLSSLRFVSNDSAPICLVCFGVHATAGVEVEPDTATADYPGELCRRLEARGVRPLFLQGAVAGTSPTGLYPACTGPLTEHLVRVGASLEAGIARAELDYRAIDNPQLALAQIPLPVRDTPCKVFPGQGWKQRVLEQGITPLRLLIAALSRQGQRDNDSLAISVLGLGPIMLLGLPCEVGPSVAEALRRAVVPCSASAALVVSLCNGYAGYVHDKQEYAIPPPKGYRLLSYYENAMSAAGWDQADCLVRLVRTFLATQQQRRGCT